MATKEETKETPHVENYLESKLETGSMVNDGQTALAETEARNSDEDRVTVKTWLVIVVCAPLLTSPFCE